LLNIHQSTVNDIATIVYTSGSTGRPKGVVLSYKNMASVAKNIRKALGLNNAQCFVSGTAPITLSLLHWYEQLNIPISEGWIMTKHLALLA